MSIEELILGLRLSHFLGEMAGMLPSSGRDCLIIGRLRTGIAISDPLPLANISDYSLNQPLLYLGRQPYKTHHHYEFVLVFLASRL